MPVRAARLARIAPAAAAAVVAVAFAAGCGSSSKPAYCDDKDALSQSVSDLGQINITAGGGELRSRLSTVQSDANALIDSARDEFAPETAALRRAVSSLRSDVQEIVAAPSASKLTGLADDASALRASVDSLVSAVDRNC